MFAPCGWDGVVVGISRFCRVWGYVPSQFSHKETIIICKKYKKLYTKLQVFVSFVSVCLYVHRRGEGSNEAIPMMP